jgi:L-fuconolactonase
MIVDSHHHLWQVSRGDYFWMDPRKDPAVAPLVRDFLWPDYAALARMHGIDASVLVQAAQTKAETRWLLSQAAASQGLIAGVVGWIDMTAPDVRIRLAALARDPLLRGIRPMLQDIADENWILRPELSPAFEALRELDLSFDLLIKPPHLPAALAILKRYPDLRAVVDHGAKPVIREEGWEPWASGILRIARETDASCKLSGLVTEARPDWTVDHLRRYVDHLLACFGPQRLMWGSDWPVALLASDYGRWLASARSLIATLSETERNAILGENAVRFYALSMVKR